MQIPTPPERQIREHLGPLIDVVLLLLIFFMVAGSLVTPEPIQIDPPTARHLEPMDAGKRLLLLAKDGSLAFEGRTTDLVQLKKRLIDHLATTPELIIVLKADAAVKARQVIDLIEALQGIGIRQVLLLTIRDPS